MRCLRREIPFPSSLRGMGVHVLGKMLATDWGLLFYCAVIAAGRQGAERQGAGNSQ